MNAAAFDEIPEIMEGPTLGRKAVINFAFELEFPNDLSAHLCYAGRTISLKLDI